MYKDFFHSTELDIFIFLFTNIFSWNIFVPIIDAHHW